MNASLTKRQRADMARCVIEAQRERWEAEGEAENADWAKTVKFYAFDSVPEGYVEYFDSSD